MHQKLPQPQGSMMMLILSSYHLFSNSVSILTVFKKLIELQYHVCLCVGMMMWQVQSGETNGSTGSNLKAALNMTERTNTPEKVQT